MSEPYSKIRIGVITIVFVMSFVLFFARLLYVQVVKAAELQQKAIIQYREIIELPAPRGEIFDIKGNKVAVNTSFKSLFAYPLTEEDAQASYASLAQIFGESREKLKGHYSLEPKKFRWIKRDLSPDEAIRFETKNTQCGLFLREEPTRTYPYGAIGAAIRGFVDIDNLGKAGIEMEMNELLSGSPGKALIQKNGLGAQYRIQEIPIKEPESGKSVVLTIDWDKQQIVEEELAWAVDTFKAKGGIAIFLDPRTGAILAAADCVSDSLPSGRPMKLKAVADVFEPGSVFKLITAAAALEGGRVKPQDVYFAENGLWRMGKNQLRDDHKYGDLTFREGFEFSSNIVMGKIANQIGGDQVFAMAKKLGFGRKTRCGLNGESPGGLQVPNRWSQYVTSAFAIGHGVSVTALQMARAMAVVASGGYLCQPYLVAGCINDEGHIVERHIGQPIRILSEYTVATLASFLRGVVERGTAKLLGDAPIAIAGKTGTAEKPNLVTGGYNKNRFIASFAGYFPADSPLVAGIVVLDEPEPIHYGGYTAGPTFENIAVKFAALDKYDVAVSVAPKDEDTTATQQADTVATVMTQVPDIVGDTVARALLKLNQSGLEGVVFGAGIAILGTRPAAHSWIPAGQQVLCYTSRGEYDRQEVPDLKGLTIREAIALLEKYDMPYSCRGQGRVVMQTPEAGVVVTKHDVVQLECQRSAVEQMEQPEQQSEQPGQEQEQEREQKPMAAQKKKGV